MWRLILFLLPLCLAVGCDSAKEAVSKVGAAAKQAADKAGTAVSKQAKEVAKTVAEKSSDAVDTAKQTTAEAVGAAGSVALNVGAPVSLNRCESKFVPAIGNRPSLLQFRTGAPDVAESPAVFMHAIVNASELPALQDLDVQARLFVVDDNGVVWDNTDLELVTLHINIDGSEVKAEIQSGQLRNTQSGAAVVVSGSMTGVAK